MLVKDVLAKEHQLEWLQRAGRRLPLLVERVDYIGNHFYPGCGFHYDSVNRAQNLTRRFAELGAESFCWEIIIFKVVFESLERTVTEAEKYIGLHL